MSIYLNLHYHLIFSAKHREPWLTPSLRIAVQEAHHRKRSFREELIGLLEKSGVRYDAKYLD